MKIDCHIWNFWTFSAADERSPAANLVNTTIETKSWHTKPCVAEQQLQKVSGVKKPGY